MHRLLVVCCLVLTLPVLALLGAWFSADAQSWQTLHHQWHTVLPEYTLTTLGLVLLVSLGVSVVGGLTALTVTLFDFPGRKWFEALLLLPLAMPAYVLAYAWTDTLQYSGPLQSAWRQWSGSSAALWPDVRNIWGAALLFTFSLYPYVYLLTRSALAERGVHLLEAARTLGCTLPQRIWRVALPLARPALAAGTALALMETLADYGVGSYFGLSTFTTGIYRAWLSMGDRHAAAQLATVLLMLVALVVSLEQAAQKRMRFAGNRLGPSAASNDARAIELHGAARCWAWLVCLLPVLLGFVLPVLALLRLLWQGSEGGGDDGLPAGLPWARFAQWCFNSFWLAALTALLATGFALAMAFARRQGQGGAWLGGLGRAVSLGYAVPGAVVVIGILWPAGALQSWWPASGAAAWLTTTVLGLVYAYMVRFSAVALHSVEAGYTRLPLSLDESARMLGLGHLQLWWRIHWPLLRSTVWATGLLVFVDVMKELPATLVLRPFNHDTLAVIANQLARDERLGEAALPCLAIVLVGLVPVLLLQRTQLSQTSGN